MLHGAFSSFFGSKHATARRDHKSNETRETKLRIHHPEAYVGKLPTPKEEALDRPGSFNVTRSATSHQRKRASEKPAFDVIPGSTW